MRPLLLSRPRVRNAHSPDRRPLVNPRPRPPQPWWSGSGASSRLSLDTPLGIPQPTPVRGGLRLFLTLSRKGRQLSAEIAGGLGSEGPASTTPITTFTGGWIARLLGYGRKYRGSRLIETFLATALRTYLVVYPFAPLALCLQGPVSSFGPLWGVLNTPANQVFINPISRSYT